MKLFLKHFLIAAFFFLLGANLISIGSLYFLNKSDFYKPSFLANSVKETNFDYVIIGASTGLTTLNTNVIDSISNKNGFNLSIDDTGIENHYLMLKHFLAEGKKTNYCVLVSSIDGYNKEQNYLGDNDYRFLPFVHKDYVKEYYSSLQFKKSTNFLKYSKWQPFLGVSYYNSELFFPSLVSAVQPNKRNRFDENGNYTYPDRKVQFDKLNKTDYNVKFSNDYLKKIRKLCEENQIELIYYFSPIRNKTLKFNEVKEIIIDHSNIFNDDSYFYDDIHVNAKGNKEASIIFSEELMKLN